MPAGEAGTAECEHSRTEGNAARLTGCQVATVDSRSARAGTFDERGGGASRDFTEAGLARAGNRPGSRTSQAGTCEGFRRAGRRQENTSDSSGGRRPAFVPQGTGAAHAVFD